jgi:peptidoglycan-associated lipoprotein
MKISQHLTFRTLVSVAVASAALLAVGCAKKPEVATDPAAAAPTDSAATAAATGAAAGGSAGADAVSSTELENQRAQLETLINKIMSEDVYFDFDRSELTDKARGELTQVGDVLRKQNKFYVVVEGHTDAQGTESYNMSLGSKRSQAVMRFLVDYGVESERLQTVSFGEEKPKAEGEDEASYAQNRRAHFSVKIR